jgi:hypothetical protein
VRVLDIPAYRGLGFGAFDNAGREGDPGALARAIKSAAMDADGTAGPEFVHRMMAETVTSDGVRAMADKGRTKTARVTLQRSLTVQSFDCLQKSRGRNAKQPRIRLAEVEDQKNRARDGKRPEPQCRDGRCAKPRPQAKAEKKQ